MFVYQLFIYYFFNDLYIVLLCKFALKKKVVKIIQN